MALLPWPSVTSLTIADQQKCYHFDPTKPLGNGAFGVVFDGKDKDGESVALKAFKPGTESISYHAQEAAMFEMLRGARFTLQLVESFHDAHTGIPVLVTAPLCACTLEERIELHATGAAAYGRDEALRWSLQLCTVVLDFMDRQVCHEDLSPRNVLLTTLQGDVVVADPGVALRARQFGIPSELAIRQKSHTLAPEVSGGGRFDMRSDWFGVGACMCMLFMGSLSTPGEGEEGRGVELTQWLEQDSAAMHQLLPDATERALVREVVLGLLEPRPQDRMTPNLAINRLARLMPTWPLPGGEVLHQLLLECEEEDDQGVELLCIHLSFAPPLPNGSILQAAQHGGRREEEAPSGVRYTYALEEAWWRAAKGGNVQLEPLRLPLPSDLLPDYCIGGAPARHPRVQLANVVLQLAQEHAGMGQMWWSVKLCDTALELAQGVTRPEDLALDVWASAITVHFYAENRARALEILDDALHRVEQWADDAKLITGFVSSGSLDMLRQLHAQVEAPAPLYDRIEALAARAGAGGWAGLGKWVQADEEAALKTRREHGQRRTEALLYEATMQRLLQLHANERPEALESALALLPRAAAAWARGLYVGSGPFIAWGQALRMHLCCPVEATEGRVREELDEGWVLARVEALLALGDASARQYEAKTTDRHEQPFRLVFLIRNDNEGRSRPAAVRERERLRALVPDPWAVADQWLARLYEAGGGEASQAVISRRLCLRRADVAMGRATFSTGMSDSQRSLAFQRAVRLYERAAALGEGGPSIALHHGCLQDCVAALVQEYPKKGKEEEGGFLGTQRRLVLLDQALSELDSSEALLLPPWVRWQAEQLQEQRILLHHQMGRPDLATLAAKALAASVLQTRANQATDWTHRLASRLIDLLLSGACVEAAVLCYPLPFPVGPTNFDSSLTRELHAVPYSHSLSVARSLCSTALESAGAYETTLQGYELSTLVPQARVELHLRDVGRTTTLAHVLNAHGESISVSETMEGLARLACGEEEGPNDWQAMLVEERLSTLCPQEEGMQDKERHLRAGLAYVATGRWGEAKGALECCQSTADGPESARLLDLAAKLLLYLASQQLGLQAGQSEEQQRAHYVQLCVEVLSATEPSQCREAALLLQHLMSCAADTAATSPMLATQALVVLEIAVGVAEQSKCDAGVRRVRLAHTLGCKANVHLEVGQVVQAEEALTRAKQVAEEPPRIEAAYLEATLRLAVVRAAAAMGGESEEIWRVIEEVQGLLDAVLPRGPHRVRTIFAGTLLISRLLGPHAAASVADGDIDAALNSSIDGLDALASTLMLAANASPSQIQGGRQQRLRVLRTLLQVDERRRALGMGCGQSAALARLAGDVHLKLAQLDGGKAHTYLPAAVQAYRRDLAAAEPLFLANALSHVVNVMATSIKPAPGKKLSRGLFASMNAVMEAVLAGGCQEAAYPLAVGLFNVSMLQRRRDALQSLERAVVLLDAIGVGGDAAMDAQRRMVIDTIGACRSCSGTFWPYNVELMELLSGLRR